VDRVAGTPGESPRDKPPDASRSSAPPGAVIMKPATGSGRPADPLRYFPSVEAPAPPHVVPPSAQGIWIYDVSYGPQWNYFGQLYYRTKPARADKPEAEMSWTSKSGSSSTWFLGVFEANHPSHADMRFPGFFLHPAYFPPVLRRGDRIRWELPWLYAGPAGEAGWVRRYEMRVTTWEKVEVPAGKYDAARLEGTLRYVEPGRTAFEIRYTLWYAPAARQVVRVLWLGRAPDDSHGEMIAELSFYGDKYQTMELR
jgi:hypothetical protein